MGRVSGALYPDFAVLCQGYENGNVFGSGIFCSICEMWLTKSIICITMYNTNNT